MKVQIINLEPFDDIVSARDKLGWVKADRVIVVWPGQGRVLTRRIDLVLLQRRASEMGARLGLVSHDPEVRRQALELHLPIFDSLDQAHSPDWPAKARQDLDAVHHQPEKTIDRDRIRAARRARRMPSSLVSRMVAGQGILIASILLLSTFVPWAEIELNPVTSTLSSVVSLQLDPDLDTPQSGLIPAEQVNLILEGSLRMPTNGQVAFPSRRSSGVVVFTNLGDQSVTIPAGTGLRIEEDGELRFVTLEPVNLPARENSRVEAPIEAAMPGSDGNLPAGAISAVEGPLGLQVEVTNPEPTTGGADEVRSGVAASDPPAARRLLLDQLLDQAHTQLESDLEEGQALAEGSLRVEQVLSQEYDRQAGQAGDTILVEMRVQFEAWIYSPQEAEAAIRPLIDAERPDDSHPVPGTLVIEEELDRPLYWHDDQLYFRVEEEVYYGPSQSQILRMLWFIPPDRALYELSQRLELETPPDLTLFPPWWPRLPILEMRIDLIYPWEAP